jgi:GxxExxY protein
MKMIKQISTAHKADMKQTQDEITRKIIGCCFKVHNALGPGFPEKVYQAALAISLQEQGLIVERERRFTVSFDENAVGEFHVDLLVQRCVIVEVKAVTGVMPKVFRTQLLAYLKAANVPAGLLVNFGNPGCEVKRVTFSALSDLSTNKSDVSTSNKHR